MTSKLITINAAKTVAVNQAVYWIPVGPDTPRGVKLLLIDRNQGVAVLSRYLPHTDWTHWQGLPKFLDHDSKD